MRFQQKIFGILALAIDAYIIATIAQNKLDCSFVNELTAYFDYKANAAFGIGIFAGVVCIILAIASA